MQITRRAMVGALVVARPVFALAGARFARDLKITLLSTGLAGGPRAGLGEWGFSAFVEVDGRSFLYDTGAEPGLVLKNAAALHIDLSTTETVILSHFHPDHVGGLLSLRAAYPAALSRVEAAQGIFAPRYYHGDLDLNPMTAIKPAYEATGGRFRIHDRPAELAPGLWFTGPVARHTDEHNWQSGISVGSPAAGPPDVVAEDSALVILTGEGVIVLTGCGHAGVINILEAADTISGEQRLLAVVGGLHLNEASEAEVDRAAAELKRRHVRYLLLGHCSGVEATGRLRYDLELPITSAALGAIGSSFTLGKGLGQPLSAL